MHQGPLGPLVDSYTEEEYLADLLKVTGARRMKAWRALRYGPRRRAFPWMEEHGVRFQPSLSGTLSLARTNAFFLGGGKGLVNAYYRTAERLGVEVVYEAQVTHLELDEDRITSVDYIRDGQTHRVTAKSVVVASGDFRRTPIGWPAPGDRRPGIS